MESPARTKNCFQAGDSALIVDRKARQYLINLVCGETFHSHLGRLFHDQMIDHTVGGWYRTDKGHTVLAVRPTLGDFVRKMPRGPQIIYPKDLGNITNFADIFPGATLIEGGLGSGSLTSAMLRAVGSEGRVITYEIDETLVPRAIKNIEKFHPSHSNHTVFIGDIYEGIHEQEVDRVVLDVPEPWRAVETIGDALVMGGIVLSFVPTIIQVQSFVLALERDTRFQMIESIETMLRSWHVTQRSVRPDHRMIAHSGFLTTAVRCEPRFRAALPDQTDEDGGEDQGGQIGSEPDGDEGESS
ncbi:MAG TPA: tRNA (adenine-N1)-methyltransferase [Dehalococcoidia bacterium]|nr:tRNA (adenine-N1)-methyltransferase [Dehalococcoidia bacterium]